MTVGYIVWKLTEKQHTDFSFGNLWTGIKNHIGLFSFTLFLMPVNWLLESLKWKLIVSAKKNISLKQAIACVLAGVTTGTATPNRIGEFAGRIFLIDDENRFDFLLLSFVSSFCQVVVTIIFGLAGFFLMLREDVIHIPGGALISFSIVVFLFCLLPFFIRFIPVKMKTKIKTLLEFPAKKLIGALLLSAIRYFVYATQFVLLFSMFNHHNPPPYDQDYFPIVKIFLLVFISYFVVTILPDFSFTEVFVRGTVAGTVFNSSCNEAVFSVAFGVAVLLWTINVAVPSLAGIFFVFKLKFFKTEKLQ